MAARSENYDAVMPAPFGALGVVMRDDRLATITLLPRAADPFTRHGRAVAEVCRQMQAYLKDPRFEFDLPLALTGTVHQRKVWRMLRRLTPGNLVTYGDLARRLHTSARAVGGACRANPVPLVVPCHRVVAKSGVGGFMGATSGPEMAIKQWLLDHEGAR